MLTVLLESWVPESLSFTITERHFWKKKKKERKTFLGVGAHVVLVAKNLPATAGNIRDSGSIPGLGKLFGGGHGNPLQYYCLENPMDRGAWQTAVHRVAKNWT